jgi:AcrR family transcriptional regulator
MTKHAVSAARPRRYRGVDAAERVLERRKQFLEAGLECFGTRGYHVVTVRELCLQAQLTERYFYESFESREALFVAVYEDLIATLRTDFLAAAAPKAPDLIEMARAGLGVFFRGLQRDPRVARMLLVEVLTVSQDVERRAQQATFGFGDLLKQMATATLPGRARPKEDMDLVATGLIGACVHMAMRWVADDFRQPVKSVIDTALSFFSAAVSQMGAAPKP